MKITLQNAIREVRREVGMRERLYPQWIASGKLNKAVAERQLARLKFALEVLEGKQPGVSGQAANKGPGGQQQELFE